MLKKTEKHLPTPPFSLIARQQTREQTHSIQPPLHLFYLITRARTPALCMLQQLCLPTIYLRMRAQATAKTTKKHTPDHPIYLRLRTRATAKTTKKHLSPFTPHHHIPKPSHAPHLTTLSTPKHDYRLIATPFSHYRTITALPPSYSAPYKPP